MPSREASGPRPLRPPTTTWRRAREHDLSIQGVQTAAWRRTVDDGRLLALVSEEPGDPDGLKWHLSISFRDDCKRHTRYPSWDEIAHARYELLPSDRTFALLLPPKEDYISVHPTTFHLHELPADVAARFARPT